MKGYEWLNKIKDPFHKSIAINIFDGGAIEGEIFVPIIGFEDRYEVSNLGKVRELQKGNIKAHIICVGYPTVHLYKNNKRKKCYIHRLLGDHFIPNYENKKTINHIDGDKKNFSLDNLEWATQSENNKHAFRTGLRKIRTGELCTFSKLVLNTQTGIFYYSAKEAAKTINMHEHTFRCKLSGWARNNTPFMYV